jgi:hypothetical protein
LLQPRAKGASRLLKFFKPCEKNYQEGSFQPGMVARTGFCYLSLQRIFTHYTAASVAMQVPALLTSCEAILVCGDLLRIAKRKPRRKSLSEGNRIENSQNRAILLSSSRGKG